MNGVAPPPFFTAGAAAIAGTLMYFAFSVGAFGERFTFAFLTLLLLVYLSVEIARVRREQPMRWVMNPAVFGALLTFVLSYGVTNLLFFLPAEQMDLLDLPTDISPVMVKLMWLALIAAPAMTMGYWSPFASNLTSEKRVAWFQRTLLPSSNDPRPLALPLLLVLATVARFTQIRLGLFGYSSRYDQLIELGHITQYLAMLSGLGKLALVISALQYFSNRGQIGGTQWFYFILANEVIWGILSGFKQGVVFPFVIVAVCMYLATGTLSRKWVSFAVTSIFLSYIIIEPFRVMVNDDVDVSRQASVSTIADALLLSGKDEASSVDTAALPFRIADRMNFSHIGSFGIAYADENPGGSEGDPQFLANIFLAPAYALIPRVLWEGKPLSEIGYWYNRVIMGATNLSSTAMGPITYLYLAYGALAVFLGFFFMGVLQRMLWELSQPWKSLPGAVLFISMLQTIGVVDSAFDGIIVALFRDLPLLLMVQFLLFGRKEQANRMVSIA